MKKIITMILSAIFCVGVCAGFVGCGEEKDPNDKSFYYGIFSCGEINVRVGYRGCGEYEVEYEEGTTYSFSFREYDSEGNSTGVRLPNKDTFGPEPGTYYMSTMRDEYTLKFIIKEPVDTQVQPEARFDPNGAIEYEDGVRYVYEYDDQFHYPLIYGEYQGEKIDVQENLYQRGITYCEDEEGNYVKLPYKPGIYIVGYRVGSNDWSTKEENEKYLGVSATVTVEIIEKAS